MELVILSDHYPSAKMPGKGVFVYHLVQELSHFHHVTVVAPFRFNHLFKPRTLDGYGNERCKVYRPVYFSFSNKRIMGIDTGRWSRYFMAKAVYKCLKKLPCKPDLIYTHFLSNAFSGLAYCQKYAIPLVVASGESSYPPSLHALIKELDDLKTQCNHFICVSDANRKGLIELGFTEEKMSIIPNAVNYDLFKPLDKLKCKEQLGIPQHKFVVGFVGSFIHRKGPNRVIEAIQQLADKDIQLVCVGGKGNLQDNNFTQIIPPVPNFRLPEIYNAFDVFVLPTLSEGHCNAIEEAKACCVPVISSLGTSVETQIDPSIGILINPSNINEIAGAIRKLKDQSELYKSMVARLQQKTGEQSLKNRAKKISYLLNNIAKLDNKQ